MSTSSRKIQATILIAGFCLLCSTVGSAAAPAEQMVNPKLAKRMELYKPSLQPVGDRVHAVIGYDYSNYAYIEGDDGIIVIDTGWFPGQAKRSIADYREQISDKPIAAIIYTHSHIDHNGAVSAIMGGPTTRYTCLWPQGLGEMDRREFQSFGTRHVPQNIYADGFGVTAR